jgi:hypothetical protein
MSNFHLDLSLKLLQGEVHDFSGEVQKLSREVRTSSHLPSKSDHATNEQQDKRKGINKNSHSCIKHPTRRKTTSLLVLLYIFIGPILADIIIYKSSIIKFYRCRTEDTRPYFKFTVEIFSRSFNTFLDFKICESGINVFREITFHFIQALVIYSSKPFFTVILNIEY